MNSMDSHSIYIAEVKHDALESVWVAVKNQKWVGVYIGRTQKLVEKILSQRFPKSDIIKSDKETKSFKEAVDAYLLFGKSTFDLPVDWSIFSPFQAEILQIVYDIPFGAIRTYGEIANQIGNPNASRAVGRANATNPIPLVIPCHRVIGSNGKLHGYNAPGGIETKRWLLGHEGVNIGYQPSLF